MVEAFKMKKIEYEDKMKMLKDKYLGELAEFHFDSLAQEMCKESRRTILYVCEGYD